ncbi:hypothetical protein [Clostridium botulinum]|uniref:hypothetical protein n=1 Tax=Clostridium botulinum TaxID=1491 RepID=UPI001C9AC373|nr:hypothetical protein [Clostridium botulinum]MBY6836005.1 hypothetical protein [Clostridium botulinum]MBY6929776.1 hypothetical protein [Clostridium botulinum]
MKVISKDDKIIELLEKILEEVSSIQTNTSWNDNHLKNINFEVENIAKQLKKEE